MKRSGPIIFMMRKDPKSLPYDKVLSIFEDSHRQIWLTTQGGGFCLFHPETETFTSYDSRNGLPNDVVYQIVEDKDGLMWLTTNNGLVSFSACYRSHESIYYG